MREALRSERSAFTFSSQVKSVEMAFGKFYDPRFTSFGAFRHMNPFVGETRCQRSPRIQTRDETLQHSQCHLQRSCAECAGGYLVQVNNKLEQKLTKNRYAPTSWR